MIPSSQSDEQNEMVPHSLPRDPILVMQEVDRWRNEARSPISVPRSEPQEDTDMNANLPDARLDLGIIVEEVLRPGFTPEPSPEPQQQSMSLTPQRSRLLQSLPVTPVALTEASKTAKIIADIKAKAYAAALSSPENSPLGELKELEDSSDEEEEDHLLRFNNKVDPFSSPLSPVPTTTRYSLRDRSAWSTASSNSRKSPSPSSQRRSRAPPLRGPITLAKCATTSDPLGALLKEKYRADQGGKGGGALRQAEAAMRAESLLSEDDEGNPEDWTDEAAALAAVESRKKAWNTSGAGQNNSDGEEVSLNDEDRCRLLGEKRGKAVVGILASDRAKREAAKGTEKTPGVPLWHGDTTPMDTDQIITPLPDSLCRKRISDIFKSSVENGDLARASLLLSSGLFASSSLIEHEDSISYLCGLALTPRDTSLSVPAFRVLSQIWNSPFNGPSVRATGMPFHAVHIALIRLGASQAVMNSMEWAAAPGVHQEPIQSVQRDKLLYRLIRLIAISAQSAPQKPSEVPNFVMALIFVGMDPATSTDLRREIMIAVDLLCQSFEPPTDISAETETNICNKLLNFACDLEPINKAQVMTLLAGGSGRSSRIARWVAHGILTRSTTISVADYSDLPPLAPLLELVIPTGTTTKTGTRGIFELYSDTDYTDLAFHVRVLAVAISNVQGYVLEEARVSATVPTKGSPGKPFAEKPDTVLTLMRNAIENLHSRIVDTRAAHLDRSRVKGALKQLSMRIHFQQEAVSRSRRGKKSRPIQQYFAKPK
ncbi:hypothetical protein B0H15DRAFT_399988 [Mycena belliarum]|uniref:Uncharacterized protein n=1 Tax=Mycena belliarum TaxID=1033014 RepID=A0AAD6TZ64_9AGAR|nr:hypothetical protein B0H15DRAFT_399988 [Mycena belliae]